MANSAVAYMLSATCAGLVYTAIAMSGPVASSNAAVGVNEVKSASGATPATPGSAVSDAPASHMCSQMRSASQDYASLFFKV